MLTGAIDDSVDGVDGCDGSDSGGGNEEEGREEEGCCWSRGVLAYVLKRAYVQAYARLHTFGGKGMYLGTESHCTIPHVWVCAFTKECA